MEKSSGFIENQAATSHISEINKPLHSSGHLPNFTQPTALSLAIHLL
jgi:hypothetical protein